MGNKDSNLQETEATVLGVLLNDSHAIIPVMGVLDSADVFSTQAHQAVYAGILGLTKENIVPNVHTVAERTGYPLDTLQGIARHFNTKHSKEVLYLADIVARAAKWRQIDATLRDVQGLANERPADLEGFTVLAATAIAGSIDARTERDPAIAEVGKRLDAEIALQQGDGLIGYTTGLDWLDDKTGGLCPSHVWVISAPYKGRKTTTARNLVRAACRAGAAGDVFALEGDQGSTAAGLRAMLATERLHKWGCRDEMILSETFVRRGKRTEAQQDALAEAVKELSTWNLRIYDGRDRIGTAEAVGHKVKRDRFMFGLKFFVIDYLQLLGTGKLFDRVEASTQALQRMTAEEGITGIMLAQLNEATIWTMKDEENESYSPGVKGGGDPAAAADFLIRTKYDPGTDAGKLTLQLKLARHAQPGSKEYRINPQSGLILGEA